MNRTLCYAIISTLALPGVVPADQGHAGTSGACFHVIGPVGSDGHPVGFTCQDIGGSALLVWNASQSADSIDVRNGIKSVNFFPSEFTFDGTYTSTGPVAFIGGGGGTGLFINGTISAPQITLAAIDATENDAKSLLGADPATVVASSSSLIYFGTTAKVTAQSGNLIVVASTILNDGSLNAPNGDAVLKTGSRMKVNWDSATWDEGKTGAEDHTITNNGTITGQNITLEAQRDGTTVDSIINAGRLSATGEPGNPAKPGTITFITGVPGQASDAGVYSPGFFGVRNNGGTIVSAQVTISPYFKAAPGGVPQDRTFHSNVETERAGLVLDISGGEFFATSHDTPPVTTTAATLDAGRSFTVTSDIVLPQLAPSLTHLNAASNQTRPMLVASKREPEQVRGDTSKPSTSTKPKARTKAKPVLVRGAFFNSKISATVAHNP